ncbi:hypothetical protein ACLMNJ_00235 [Streptomyces seoulensis]
MHDPEGAQDSERTQEPPPATDPPASLESADGTAPARPRRPRGRTTLMIAAAAVLGVVAGSCTGYLIQADRRPTALPPLSQPVVPQATGEVEPLSAAQDRRVKVDGDLRKLLVERPAGAQDADSAPGQDGWLDQAAYAEQYTQPSGVFIDLARDGFRRSAVTSWQVGETHTVDVVLTQFRQEENPAAKNWTELVRKSNQDGGGIRSWLIPGTGEGRVYVHDTPDQDPGYLPVYTARAYGWRGDISMEISIDDDKPISKAEIMNLAKSQMGKL